MKRSFITNTAYKIILLAYITLGVVTGFFSLFQGSESIFMGLVTLVVNILILVLYVKRHWYLKFAVKAIAGIVIAASAMSLFLSGFIGLFMGGGMLMYTMLSVVLIGLGLYLFIGSNSYIQTETVQE